ncbi:hypothetical protein CU098_011626, partial [Rhizopus stolonifer]
MSTVTRRRVAGHSANSDDDNTSNTDSTHNSPITDKKIAYDPRDIDESKSTPNYALRGCIVIELALRGRISMVKDPNRRKYALCDRHIEVINDNLTGEVLLDEALKMMKVSDKMSVSSWIDLMSGETWNVMKIGYQLKQ